MTALDWPVILLVMRITVVVLLYLFVLIAVRALRAEIRERTMPVLAPALEPATVPVAPAFTDEEPAVEALEPAEPLPDLEVVRPRRRPAWSLLAPLSVGIPLLLVAVMMVALRLAPPPAGQPVAPTSQSPAQQAPTAIPGRIAISLAATEDSNVRVTIDGTVQFEGAMRPGERRNWDGKSLVAVWTDKGKTLGITIDGRDLGPYSPAMGHPDWNRIEYSFWPGWSSTVPR